MARMVDHDNRRKAILAATIERYTKDAQPVASDDLAKQFGLSSATIRNIFSELEDAGYLMHPHTSAGRIPTDKGFRYYVDFLVLRNDILDEEKQKVAKEYRKEIKRLEDALEKTTQVLSVMTHYAGIVSFLEWHDKIIYNGLSYVLDEPEFKDSGRIRFLVRMIEEKQKLLHVINKDFKEKVKVYIGDELGSEDMNSCALVVSQYSRKKKPSGKVAVLGPARMNYEVIMPKLAYISDILSQVLDDIEE
jgi:heat-inducible transcriptional repressor